MIENSYRTLVNSAKHTTTLLIAIIGGSISAACMTFIMAGKDQAPIPEGNVSERIKRLETTLKRERQARLDQEALIASLQNSIYNSMSPSTMEATPTGEQSTPPAPQSNDVEQSVQLSPNEQRHFDLVNAGFSDSEAREIARRESTEALQTLQQQHQLRLQSRQRLNDDEQARVRRNNPLRDELGDESYEKYLRSRGLPTEVDISNVLVGSAGDSAGLKPGDKLRNYDGERVFSVRELNQLTLLGEQGESVLIEVERDGQPVQVTIPRGPIGIYSDGYSPRARR